MDYLKVYRFVNVLSIDVVAGAVGCALFFSSVFHSEPEPLSIMVLALSVWSIYTLDHLLDASLTAGTPSGKRHQFHRKYARVLWICLGVSSTIAGILTLFLPVSVLQRGGALLVLVFFYMIAHKKFGWLKEFSIALIYTAGVITPSASFDNIQGWDWLLIVQFLLTAFLNLMLFSWYDIENDVKDGHVSGAIVAGRKISGALIIATFLLITMLMIPLQFTGPALTIWVMSCAHMLLLLFPRFFRARERYRIVGDAIFFIPLVYYFLQ